MRWKHSRGSVSVWAFYLGALSLLVLPSCGGDEPVGTGNKTDDSADAGGSKGDESEGSPSGSPSDSESDSPTSGSPTSGSPTSGSPTSGSPTTTTGETTTPPDDLPLGTAVGIGCTDDEDCISPLTCVRSEASFRGSIPGTGICSMPCETDDQCVAVDGLAVCGVLGAATPEAIAAAAENELPEGLAPYCVQLCPFGLDTYKCGDLATSTCYPVGEVTQLPDNQGSYQLGLCTPICNTDDDCSNGEHCDPAWGMCLEEAPEGKALGEVCDPASEELQCAGGFCDSALGICSTFCNQRNDTPVCGGEPGPDADSACLPLIGPELLSSYSDIGQCFPLCDSDDDCLDGFTCDVSQSDIIVDIFGRPGVCFPSDPETAPDAGAPPGDTTEPDSTAEPVGDAG